MSRRLFSHRRRADNGLVAADGMTDAKKLVAILARMKDRVASMSPELMLKDAREFGLAMPERFIGFVQRVLFKHTTVTPTLTQLLSLSGPTSLPAAYKFYAENLVRASELTAYMGGSDESFRGHLRIENGDGGLRMIPHTGDLNLVDDRLVHAAVEQDRVVLLSKKGVLSVERGDLERRILIEPGFFDGESRMVIPFDKRLGLLDVRGENITFGNLILPDSAALTTALVLSNLVSMKMVAELDPLTGLFSRRAYDELMTYFADAYLATGQDMALLMFDLDHFKWVNDEYGHMTGDHVLAGAASVAVTTLRASDVVARAANGDGVTNGNEAARYGGEEFAFLLPGADTIGACIAANRCREDMAAFTVRAPNGDVIGVTATMGIAALSDAQRVIDNNLAVPGVEGSFAGPDAADSLICCVKALADAALYRGKDLGRDRVVRVVTKGVGKRVDFEQCG